MADRCGTCTRCVTACPTAAIEAGYVMDPRRCISYLTIEHRSAIPRALRPGVGNWIFGCDVCQEVCPWNAAPTDAAAEVTAFLHPPLLDLLALDDAGFAARFAGTALTRAGRAGLARNVAVALGNSGNPDAVPALAQALDDPAPLVRAHAAWALGRLRGAAARAALDHARPREPSAEVVAEIAAALAGEP
jgi:epoxyqueuosine reductase